MSQKHQTKYAWQFAGKMEGFTDNELKKRIQQGMDKLFEHRIRPIPYLGKVHQVITHTYPELEALCPVTGIHDLYDIKLVYEPNELLPELKSLKFWFWEFRTHPISHEHLAARIYRDLKETLNPRWLNVYLMVADRGEIKTTVIIKDSEDELCNCWRDDQID